MWLFGNFYAFFCAKLIKVKCGRRKEIAILNVGIHNQTFFSRISKLNKKLDITYLAASPVMILL